MRCSHDLGTTPSLVDTDITDEVAGLHAAVGTVTGELRAAASNRAGEGARCHRAETRNAGLTGSRGNGLVDDLSRAARFRSDRRRQTVAELGGIASGEPARIARIRRRIVTTAEARGRDAVEVVERLRQTGG